MSEIALFHSVLGVRPGVHVAADVLRAAGHEVHIVDQYDGTSFDDYEKASAFADDIGYPALMKRALDAVSDRPAGLVYAGFSNGGGMAQHVAGNRLGARAVVLFSGVLAPSFLGLGGWPARVPAQIHYTLDDPFRDDKGIAEAVAEMREAPAHVEQFDYPGSGHLFTDPSLPDEYDPAASSLLWHRVLAFLASSAD